MKHEQTIAIGTVVRVSPDTYTDKYVNFFDENTGNYGIARYSGSFLESWRSPSELKIQFTIQDALKIQAEHLKKLQTVLKPEVFSLLKIATIASNKGVINPYGIRRGGSLDTWVANYRPGRKLSEIYF